MGGVVKILCNKKRSLSPLNLESINYEVLASAWNVSIMR